MLSHVEMITRMAAGAALGGVIGYERDLHRRPVGLRTHLIVALTAATFMVVSSQFIYFQHYGPRDLVTVDTSRIAASVVSAVGFLAGGAILKTGLTILGLTTAAGLWLVTAIGMAAGAGMYIESVAVTVLGLTALTVVRRFEDKQDNVVRRRLSVTLRAGGTSPQELLEELKRLETEPQPLSHESRLTEPRSTVAVFEVLVPASSGFSAVVEHLEKLPGIERVFVESPN